MNNANLIHGVNGRQHVKHTAGCAMLAAVLTVTCGGGDSNPATPAAATTPPPAPPPPVLQAHVSVYSVPSPYSGLYTEGTWIRLITEFEEPVRVEDSPRLGIRIGEELRYAEFAPYEYGHRYSGPDHKNQSHAGRDLELMPRFDYLIREDDIDLDGFSIGLDAFDFSEGSLLNEAGQAIGVEITSVIPAQATSTMTGINPRRVWLPAVEPGSDLDSHPVDGTPRPRTCTDEVERARGLFPVLVEEWDGIPFTFHFNLAGVPPHLLGEADRMVEAAERLSDRIEDQIGYRIFEVGGLIDDPSIEYPARNECPWREPGQIVGMYRGEGSARANTMCAMWGGGLMFGNGTVAHEMFHLFGFNHSPNDWRGEHDYWRGYWMSLRLNGVYVDEEDVGVAFEDVDALRCIFPEGG